MQTSRHVLHFPATLAAFNQASTELQRLLDEQRLNGQMRFDVELAFEEIAVNIVRHAESSADVEVSIDFGDREVVLTFEDDGVAFDPLQRADPEPPESIEDAPIGGRGVMLVKKLAARTAYERTAQHRNRFTVAISAR